jgi:hypothetical protein
MVSFAFLRMQPYFMDIGLKTWGGEGVGDFCDSSAYSYELRGRLFDTLDP